MCTKGCNIHINIRNTTYLSFSPPFLIENGTFVFFPTRLFPWFPKLAFWAISRAKIFFLSLSLSLPQWHSNLVMLVLFLTFLIIANPRALVTSSESFTKSSCGGTCTFFLYFLYKINRKHPISQRIQWFVSIHACHSL